jgi:adenylate cyclase
MFTDMVGYTASAQIDEASTLKLLREQEELVRPLFPPHRGHEIKSTGDGFLVEFDSALSAVRCAVDILQRLHERNSQKGVAPIELRIGVHLGDVEQHGGDIFGDSVNVTARIQRLADRGGVCLSGAVREQVWNKLPEKLEKLPYAELKGVQIPMDVYRVVLPWTFAEPSPEGGGPTRVAVLPFANISPDPNDAYFADGLTEELITVLSQLQGLRVIARTSVIQFKSSPRGVSQIGAELGVSSILEGSVRKVGNRLRVIAQLVDVVSQGHLWAGTYDRNLDDVFAVQAEIARQVAESLKVRLRAEDEERLLSRPAMRSDSYLPYLKGRALLHDDYPESLEAAKAQFELAVALDPSSAAAYSGLADVTRVEGWYFPVVRREEREANARHLAARAIDLDPNLAEAHASLGLTLWDEFEYPAAEREFKIAISLNPSYSLSHQWYAGLLEDEGRTDEALMEFALAEGADPLSPRNLYNPAELLAWLGRFDEALVKIQRLGELDHLGLLYHVALTRYHLARSDLEGFLKEQQRSVEVFPDPRWKGVFRAWYYALSGEKEQSRALLMQEDTLPEFPQIAWAVAWGYAELADLDECFRWLERAFEKHLLPIYAFRLDPRREDVRSDPRFPVLLKRMNLA